MADTPVLYGSDNTGKQTRTLIANERHVTLVDEEDDAVAFVAVTYSESAGIIGQSTQGSGVVGWAGQGAPPAQQGQRAGLWGHGEPGGYGAVGWADNGTGVFGLGGKNGIGGSFEGRYSILASGRVEIFGDVQFSSVGTSVIRQGRSAVGVVHPYVQEGSCVFAQLQGYGYGQSTWVTSVELMAYFSAFTIWLNQPVADDTKVAYWIVDPYPA